MELIGLIGAAKAAYTEIALEPLTKTEATAYRRRVGISPRIAFNRLDVKFACEGVRSGVQKPTKISRLIRYLSGVRDLGVRSGTRRSCV